PVRFRIPPLATLKHLIFLAEILPAQLGKYPIIKNARKTDVILETGIDGTHKFSLLIFIGPPLPHERQITHFDLPIVALREPGTATFQYFEYKGLGFGAQTHQLQSQLRETLEPLEWIVFNILPSPNLYHQEAQTGAKMVGAMKVKVGPPKIDLQKLD
ncbi:MAG: hypothetical protein LC620_07895, partial [Halobacteriales archaeon]|nr:hypothetical protein [Halobacteriales archaeon]